MMKSAAFGPVGDTSKTNHTNPENRLLRARLSRCWTEPGPEGVVGVFVGVVP